MRSTSPTPRRGLGWALLSACLALGCTTPASIDASADSVLRAERLRARALVDADTAELERLLHADLRYTHSNGAVESKRSLLASLRSAAIDYRSIVAEAPTVWIKGPVAVVAGPVRMEVAAAGRILDLRSLFTAVYWFEDGRWQLVAYQSTPAGRD